MNTPFDHHSVLLDQTIQWLCPTIIEDRSFHYVDCTLGGAGHATQILKANVNNQLIGIDRDPLAIQVAKERLQIFEDRFELHHGPFSEILSKLEPNSQDGILMDLGVSSPQLDFGDRGFSFQQDGPLDMRMDTSSGITAAEWLNQVNEIELANVLYRYGDEPRSRRIARAIMKGRPWTSTLALAECIQSSSGYRNSRTHPATRSFQAIRIVINDELTQLEQAMPKALDSLRIGGRLAIISFHSLEDRMVKHFFKDCTRVNAPKDEYGNPIIPPTGKILTRKGIPGTEDPHPRARSARLRVLEKC